MVLGLAERLSVVAICRSRVCPFDNLASRAHTHGNRPIAALGIRKRRAASCLHLSLTSGWRRGGGDLDGKLLRVKKLGVRSATTPQDLRNHPCR